MLYKINDIVSNVYRNLIAFTTYDTIAFYKYNKWKKVF